jgi:hypothetical protein
VSKREESYPAIRVVGFKSVLYVGVICLVDLVEVMVVAVIWLNEF